MAIAGRVAIIPKGEWSENITYDKLDLVTRNGNAYIAYKSSMGVEPVDGDTWMLILESVSTDDVNKLKEDVESIINGTTAVGDSNKLGGKGASSDGTKGIPYINSDYGIMEIGSMIDFHTESGQDYRVRLYVDETTGKIGMSVYGSGTGSPLATTADLAKYLPLNGSVPMSGKLPFAGGYATVEGTSTYALLSSFSNLTDYSIRRNLVLRNSTHASGAIGTCFEIHDYTSEGTKGYTVLHTGNKPTGSYTGNGSATERTINTGGIGRTIVITSRYGTTIVSSASVIYGSGEACFAYGGNVANFNNGVLKMSTTNQALNASGETYHYQVL